MADWNKSPEVEIVARRLIGEHHGHLAEARIAYLFREGPWSSQDRTTWGKAHKVSDRDKFLTGYDFYITINKDVWDELDLRTREALVDHELSHCGQNDSGSWVIWGHDIEDFAAIVRRHGLWNESVKLYLQAAERQDNGQIKLFAEDENEEEVEEEIEEEIEEAEVMPLEDKDLPSKSEEVEDEVDYSDMIKEMYQPEGEGSGRVGWILHNSVGDLNYTSNIPLLTDKELIHCLKYEDRKSGLKKLLAEAKRRGLELPKEVGVA